MGEHVGLRELIARALWDGSSVEITGSRMVRWTSVEVAADAVLDALGLEPAGFLDADGHYWEGAASTRGLTPLFRLAAFSVPGEER